MKKLRYLLFLASASLFAQNSTLTTEDLAAFIGNWTGDLTYMDYTSGKPFTLACNVTIAKTKNAAKLRASYVYPSEPTANNTTSFSLNADGSTLNKKAISAVNRKANGVTEIFCEYEGRDGNDNKKATIRTFYTIGDEVLKIGKFVKFEGTEEWIKRNEYSFKKAY